MAKPRKQTYTMEMYLNKIKDMDIRNDADVQRHFVWSNEQINELIVTVLTDDYIPPIILGEEDNSQLRIVDGGQRSSALNKYRYGNYKITSAIGNSVIPYKTKVKDKQGHVMTDCDGNIIWEDAAFDIKNKTYEKLPDELKKKFNEYQVETIIHEHCDMHRISQYIKRYNNHAPMNTNQKAFTCIDNFAKDIREMLDSKFFLDCSNYTENEKIKGVVERVVIETVMCTNHLENWKKQTRSICTYLNNNATSKEFEQLSDNLHRLECVITEDVRDIFNSKDSFIMLTLFDRFRSLEMEDKKFVEFLRAFKQELRYIAVNGVLFDEADRDKGTKDKAVIKLKLDILESLMRDFLHVEKRGQSSIGVHNGDSTATDIVREYVDQEVTDEDMELFEMIANDVSEVIENIHSQFLSDENRPSFVALVGYAVKEDVDDILKEWLPGYEKRKDITYIAEQKSNFLHMKSDFERYVSKRNKKSA